MKCVPGSREIASSDGQSIRYDRLLLATGAEPVRHWIPRSDQAHVHSLRSLADCRAIMARAQTRAGQSFLVQILSGLRLRLLRSRGIEVHETAVAIVRKHIALKGSSILDGDVVVAGISVRPRIDLAVRAGIAVERGVVVNPCLETSAKGVFAAGDIAR
jgi:NAD(P)H-nitrite reductase large subunit